MPSNARPFRQFQQQHRPLSQHLSNAVLGTLNDQIMALGPPELSTDVSVLAAHLIDGVRIQPPSLGRKVVAATGEGNWRPTGVGGSRVGTRRFVIAIEIAGDASLLDTWPDTVGVGLQPIDVNVDGTPVATGDRHGDLEEQMAHLQAETLATLWTLGTHTGHPALLTWVDFTFEEAERVNRGELDPMVVVEQQAAVVAPIIDAISQQTKDFFDVELPQLLTKFIEDHRHRIGVWQSVEASLSWPDAWKPEPLTLEPTTPTVPVAARGTDLDLPQSIRLSPASFREVLTVTRVWASAIERTPEAFRALEEERLSDLACATLNASMPGAQREVFSRGGKTDIFVRANVIDSGTGPAKVFIFENKWWSGQSAANDALKQLFGYLEVKDTAAILMFFVRNQDTPAVRTTCADSFRSRPDFVADSDPIVDGWPVHRFTHDKGRSVDVCVAFVDLPPTAPANA